jgi:WD40 repeat protein
MLFCCENDGARDNTVQIWDVRAGHSVRSMYGPHLCGDSLDISLDGHTILTASWRPNDCLQRWDLATAKLIDTVPFAAGPGGVGAERSELLYALAASAAALSKAAGLSSSRSTSLRKVLS